MNQKIIVARKQLVECSYRLTTMKRSRLYSFNKPSSIFIVDCLVMVGFGNLSLLFQV